MARHHTKIDRLFDLKPRAFALCDTLLGWHPALRRLSGFFPDYGWPDAGRVTVHADTEIRHRLLEPRYAAELAVVSQHNFDVMNPWETIGGLDRSRTIVATVADVMIPGHTLFPVDPATGRMLARAQTGKARWSFCYPAPVALKRIDVDALCFAIPPVFHYGHLLTDVLMPLCEAVRVGALAPGEDIAVVTGPRPPLVDRFIDGLRALGFNIRHIALRPHEHVRARRYLFARSHCFNIERIFGVPEARATALGLFRALDGAGTGDAPAEKVYLKRRNHRQRVVAGEEVLVERLAAAGFAILEPDWSNHAEQVAACAGARVIAAVHGAALANILFCRPGATLIEIMAANARKSTGLHWAAESDANYVPLLGGDEERKQAFAIDPDRMADVLLAAADKAA